MLRRFLILAVLSLVLSVSQGAAAYHAWVDALWWTEQAGPLSFDTADNAEDLTYDAMSGSAGSVAQYSGYASMNQVGLYALSGGNMHSYAEIQDTYTFTNLLDPDASGVIPGFYVDIYYSGTFNPGQTCTTAAFTMSANSVGHTVCPGDPLSGVWSRFFGGVEYGAPFAIDFDFSALASHGGEVDFGATAYMLFRSTDPDVELNVVSEGGYVPIPSPGTAWLLGSGLMGLASLRKKLKG
jgi:hypothetical protein